MHLQGKRAYIRKMPRNPINKTIRTNNQAHQAGRIKVQNSVEFLYTEQSIYSEQSRDKIKNTVPFTVVSKSVNFSNAFNERKV